LTRASILLRKNLDCRVTSAFTRVFDALCPAMTEKEMLNETVPMILCALALLLPPFLFLGSYWRERALIEDIARRWRDPDRGQRTEG
jgi:hypothetical protein